MTYIKSLQIIFTVILILTMGCTNKVREIATTEGDQKTQASPIVQGIDVRDALLSECPTSGKVYSVYLDANINGLHDESEVVLSSQVVCNGAKGDTGQNGYSLVFETIAASSTQCPNRGVVILLALDTTGSGDYSPLLPNQKSLTVCNGANGADGHDGEDGQDAVVPAYAPVESLFVCGHTTGYSEVLLRLQNGQVLASFSNDTGGTMTRLVFLPDGSYASTDGTNCVFTLATSSNGKTRSLSWGGQVRSSWAVGY